ncbi:MAG: hypothetical protein KDI13_09250 [Alphaproteobacteria bacterium]|nr:hypothetical protein [Alphaproteobacteria bacterium]
MNTFNMRATNNYWTFRWSVVMGKPVAMFSNPRVHTNILFPIDELEEMVAKNDEGKFFKIPLAVMSSALAKLNPVVNAKAVA